MFVKTQISAHLQGMFQYIVGFQKDSYWEETFCLLASNYAVVVCQKEILCVKFLFYCVL